MILQKVIYSTREIFFLVMKCIGDVEILTTFRWNCLFQKPWQGLQEKQEFGENH